MTTLREAAQQALEALGKYRQMMFAEAGCRCDAGDAAITALRAALAQQAEAKGGGRLPPPLQADPVAWKLWDENPEGGGDWRYYDAKDFKEGIDPMKYFDGLVPLYGSDPPQRQPLTKERLLYIYNQLPNWGMDMDSLPQGLEKFARAIERAHGIGEQP